LYEAKGSAEQTCKKLREQREEGEENYRIEELRVEKLNRQIQEFNNKFSRLTLVYQEVISIVYIIYYRID